MSSALRRLERVLVVEHNVAQRALVSRWIETSGPRVLEAGTLDEAKAILSEDSPDLIIAELSLPDGDGFAVLDAASQVWPVPIKLVMSGSASPGEVFRLAQFGVRAFLAKPFSLDELVEAVDAARREAPALDPLIQDAVGHIPLRELQDRVRDQMMKQALALSGGSRSGAARLLDISRQAVQQMLRRSDSAKDGCTRLEPERRPLTGRDGGTRAKEALVLSGKK
jgi:two-component system, response regulator RegA